MSSCQKSCGAVDEEEDEVYKLLDEELLDGELLDKELLEVLNEGALAGAKRLHDGQDIDEEGMDDCVENVPRTLVVVSSWMSSNWTR